MMKEKRRRARSGRETSGQERKKERVSNEAKETRKGYQIILKYKT